MTEQDSNSDPDLATEPKWRVLHPTRSWTLSSSSPWRTESEPLAAGGRASHPVTVGLPRVQQNSVRGGVRRNGSQSLSISCPRTWGCVSQARAGEAGTRVFGFQTLNQAVPKKLPTPKHAESQHFIHPIALVSDEEALTLLRPWAMVQALGPPCYK